MVLCERERDIWGGDEKEMVVLGRTVRWTEQKIEYEEDDKHRSLALDNFVVNLGAPGIKHPQKTSEGCSKISFRRCSF